MINFVINSLFLSSFAATTLVVVNLIQGSYNWVIFGINNPWQIALYLYCGLFLLYFAVYTSKYLAMKIANMLINPNLKQSRSSNLRIIDFIISFFRLLVTLLTFGITSNVAYKQWQNVSLIEFSDVVYSKKIYSLEEKLDWLMFLRQNETLKLIPQNQWVEITKEINWSEINEIQELKTVLLINYNHLLETLRSMEVKTTMLQDFIQFSYDHPFLIPAIVMGVGVGYFILSNYAEIYEALTSFNKSIITLEKESLNVNTALKILNKNQEEIFKVLKTMDTQLRSVIQVVSGLQDNIVNLNDRVDNINIHVNQDATPIWLSGLTDKVNGLVESRNLMHKVIMNVGDTLKANISQLSVKVDDLGENALRLEQVIVNNSITCKTANLDLTEIINNLS